MPVYRKKGRGRDKWRVVLSVKGEQREWTVTGTKADADAFEARKRVELEAGKLSETRTAPTFSDFCVRQYRPYAETHLRASTWKVRTYHLATLIAFFGPKKLTQITTADVDAYKKKRLEDGAKPISVNNELAVLQAVCTYARKVPVPIKSFTIEHLPVRGRGRVTFWTDEQIAALYASVKEHAPELLGVVVFLANTGCRKGEALALEWRNVDLERRMIHIEPNEEWQPKDNEARQIPVSDALLPWLAVPEEQRKSARWVFPSSTGERYACWPKRQFDRARRLAGHKPSCALLEDRSCSCRTKGRRLSDHAPACELRAGPACTCGAPGLRGGPHTLRHTFASHFLRAVPDLFLLAKVLGHSHERTTKLYAHLLPDHLARARNAVNLGVGR